MEDSPKKQGYDKSLQSFVLSSTTLAEAFIIIFFAVVAIMEIGITNRIAITYSAVPIALMGVIYNFFIWPKLEVKRPYTSTYLALAIFALSIIVTCIFTGGINSVVYPLIPILLIVSCLLGMHGYRYVLAATLITFSFLSIVSFVTTGKWSTLVGPALYTGLAAVLGWLLARSIDHYVETAFMANTITNQLDSTQLSEKLMLASIADPVVGVNKKLEIILFNSAAEDISGWDSKSALGMEFGSVIKLLDSNDKAVARATNPFLKVFAQKTQITTDQFHIVDKSNNKMSYSISVAPTFDMENNINGAIAVFHDISEQKAVQRQRNEFVSTASHEMRTPVAAIEGYLSMATNPNLATVDDRAKKYLMKAHDSSVHLGRLFQDLLSVTKIEDQRLKDARVVFSMTDLVSQVATEMEMVAKKKGLSFYKHIGSERAGSEVVVAPLYQVNADPERIREVINNLVDNAVKYTQKGSIELGLSGDRNNVKVSVRDSGIGIAVEEQKHMFEKFYRVNNTMTREIGGTGLGLYIARSLIELYSGRIWVESSPGQGSTFYFTLPLVKS